MHRGQRLFWSRWRLCGVLKRGSLVVSRRAFEPLNDPVWLGKHAFYHMYPSYIICFLLLYCNKSILFAHIYTTNKRFVTIREDLVKCHPNWIRSSTTPQGCQGSCTRFRISPTVTCLWMHILGVKTERNRIEKKKPWAPRPFVLEKLTYGRTFLQKVDLDEELYTNVICIRTGVYNKSLQRHHGLLQISISLSLSLSSVFNPYVPVS